MKTILARGNTKLAKNVGVFSLPAGSTCPGRTALCSKICYALKTERIYKSARKHGVEMEALSKDSHFPEYVAAEIRRGGFDKVRIHERGDFYDQEYLDKWFKVARLCPDVTFLAYTKSFHLDFSEKPSNMVIYASLDHTSTPEAITLAANLDFPVAVIDLGETSWIESIQEHFPGRWVFCTKVDSKRGHTHYCGDQCQDCWNGVANIFLPAH